MKQANLLSKLFINVIGLVFLTTTSIALAQSGRVVVLGSNTEGECTIPLAAQSGVSAITGSCFQNGLGDHDNIIALKDGAVLVWGKWSTGGSPMAQFGVSAIAGGSLHTIALKNGEVLVWGDNRNGQCNTPAAAQSGVTAVASGSFHSIALKSSAVLAWGDNSSGQCTIPSAAQSGISAVAGGGSHTIALKNGSVLAWGAGTTNGNYPNFGQAIVPTAALSGVTAIAGGLNQTFALKSDGSVIGWGHNWAGQCLGTDLNGDPITSTTVGEPVKIMGQVLTGVTAIACGGNHTIALKIDGSVLGWGGNGSGQCLGTDLNGDPITSKPVGEPVKIMGQVLTGVTAIACGSNHTITLGFYLNDIDFDGIPNASDNCPSVANPNQDDCDHNGVGDACELDCNHNGIADVCEIANSLVTDYNGNGIPDGCDILSGVLKDCNANGIGDDWEIANGTISDINNNGIPDSCDVVFGGEVIAWGGNYDGQCNIPVTAQSGVTAIAAGYYHTIALKNGEVLAWGRYGDQSYYAVPNAAKSGVTAIAAGEYHTIALKDGGILGWGDNFYGQCTIPSAAQSGVTAIACGRTHTIALKDGAVLAWGAGTTISPLAGMMNFEFGQSIVPVSALSGVTTIAAGECHTIALKNGSVLAWGKNWAGQCDIPIADNFGYVAIAGGTYNTIALKNGAVHGWGSNDIPTAALSGVTAIAGGEESSIALKSDGSVLGWGGCGYGKCIIPVNAQSGVTAIACGDYHTVALKASVAICQSDLDQSGEVDSSDLGNLLLNFGICSHPFCLADFDKSGEVDSSDLGNLLLDFGLCP